jgi:hypothetical protein
MSATAAGAVGAARLPPPSPPPREALLRAWHDAEAAASSDAGAAFQLRALLLAAVAGDGGTDGDTREAAVLHLLSDAALEALPPSSRDGAAGDASGLRPAAAALLRAVCAGPEGDAVVALLLCEAPSLFRDAFRGRGGARAATAWFDHFSATGGTRAFKRGAAALATYALSHRDEARRARSPPAARWPLAAGCWLLHLSAAPCTPTPAHASRPLQSQVWDMLVWGGRHGQAPAAVAAKPHLFCELDVPSTVAALADRCPGFWRSEAFERSLISGGGEALAIDPPFFAREVGGRLRTGGRFREDLRAVAARHLRAAPWSDTCREVAAEMDGGETLALGSAWSARRVPPPARAAAALPPDAPDLLRAAALGGSPRWRTLGEAALAHAAGCARPQLSRLMAAAGDGARAALEAVRDAGAALLDAAAAGAGGGAAPLLAGLLRGVDPAVTGAGRRPGSPAGRRARRGPRVHDRRAGRQRSCCRRAELLACRRRRRQWRAISRGL